MPRARSQRACRIGCQAQEALLGKAAKVTDFIRQRVEPRLGGGMMDMRVEGQREPHVNVGEKRLLHPESLRCVCRSTVRCRAHWFEREEPGSASSAQAGLIQWSLGNERSR